MGAPIEPWRKVPPRCHDDEPKQRVAECEDPGRRLVVQDTLKPMLDKTTVVGCCARLGAQPHFQRGERAPNAEPGLCHDYRNGGQMRKPEPNGIDPCPGPQVANDDENKAANDKRYDGEMQREHHIGEQLICR